MSYDNYTSDELRDRIYELEDENAKLVQDNQHLDEELKQFTEDRSRLEEAAEVFASLGKIHNTPYAKRQWIEGR